MSDITEMWISGNHENQAYLLKFIPQWRGGACPGRLALRAA
jgi:hypothetical protein